MRHNSIRSITTLHLPPRRHHNHVVLGLRSLGPQRVDLRPDRNIHPTRHTIRHTTQLRRFAPFRHGRMASQRFRLRNRTRGGFQRGSCSSLVDDSISGLPTRARADDDGAQFCTCRPSCRRLALPPCPHRWVGWALSLVPSFVCNIGQIERLMILQAGRLRRTALSHQADLWWNWGWLCIRLRRGDEYVKRSLRVLFTST